MKIGKTLLLAAILASTGSVAVAQVDYPARPIRLVHGFAAGDNADVVARIIANEMFQGLGQQVIIEAKPGAGGNIASAFVTKSRPDGYTMQLMVGGHTVSAALYKSLPYDSVADYEFISTINRFPFLVAARKGAYASLKDLVAKAKAQPGQLNIGHSGAGTTQHLTGELLALQAGARFVQVPYQGGIAASTALLRSEVDLLIDAGTVITNQVAAGTFEILAVSSKERWPRTPSIPTIAETVAPNFDVVSWTGLAFPTGTPKHIVDKIRTETHRAINVLEVQQRLRALDSEPAASSGEEMLALVKRQIAMWTEVVAETGLEKR